MRRLRLRTPRQILDAVPELLGYSPMGSLVAIPLSGKHGGVVLRFDLPEDSAEATGERSQAAYAGAVVGHLSRLEGIERVVLVACPEVAFGAGPRPPLSGLLDELVLSASRAGIEVILGLCRALDAWGVYGCDDPSCCDVGPRRVQASADWAPRAGLRRPGVCLPAADVARRAAVRAADEAHSLSHCGDELSDEVRAMWMHLLDSSAPADHREPEQLAQILCMLRGTATAERLLESAAFGGDANPVLSRARELADEAEFEDGAPSTFELERVQNAIALLSHLAGCVDLVDEAGLLAVLAWLEWAIGHSSRASELARQALRVDLGHPIAGVVLWLAEQSIVPPWIGKAWRRDPGALLDEAGGAADPRGR